MTHQHRGGTRCSIHYDKGGNPRGLRVCGLAALGCGKRITGFPFLAGWTKGIAVVPWGCWATADEASAGSKHTDLLLRPESFGWGNRSRA